MLAQKEVKKEEKLVPLKPKKTAGKKSNPAEKEEKLVELKQQKTKSKKTSMSEKGGVSMQPQKTTGSKKKTLPVIPEPQFSDQGLSGYYQVVESPPREVIFAAPSSPRVLYVYWRHDVANFQDVCVRLYSGYTLLQEVNVKPYTNHWFFSNLEPNRRYHVEVGVLNDGHFYRLLRSMEVDTPSDGPSTFYAPGWEPVLDLNEMAAQKLVGSSEGLIHREW